MHRPSLNLIMFGRRSKNNNNNNNNNTSSNPSSPSASSPSSQRQPNLAPLSRGDITVGNDTNASQAALLSTSTPVLIQRLIILHDGLMPPPEADDEPDAQTQTQAQQHPKKQQKQRQEQRNKRNKRSRRRNPTAQLSEDASLEEHGEFILYYYDHHLHSNRQQQQQQRQQRRGSRRDSATSITSRGGENDLDRSAYSYGRRMSDSSQHTADNNNNNNNVEQQRAAKQEDYATEDAIRFAGVCRALRSLPMALEPQCNYSRDESVGVNSNSSSSSSVISSGSSSSGGNEDYNTDSGYEDSCCLDETEVVHLTDSTLVFVPLELDGDIIAVAQVPRAANPNRNTNNRSPNTNSSSHNNNKNVNDNSNKTARVGYGADPRALREAITQIHASFSLVCGGGIHRRLLRTRHLENSEDWIWEAEQLDDDDDNDNMTAVEDDDDNDNTDNHHEGGNGTSSPGKNTNSPSSKSKFVRLSVSVSSSGMEQWQDEDFIATSSPEKNNDGGVKTNGGSSHGHTNNSPTATADTTNNQKSNHNFNCNYRYGGMKELFHIRKEYRKLANEREEVEFSPRHGGLSRRWSSCNNPDDLFNDIINDIGNDDCQRRIEKLLQVLPITKLREDLTRFYDEWLVRWQSVCEVMEGGVGRCLVEMVPAPIWRAGGGSVALRGQHPPLAPEGFVSLAASEFMKSLMEVEVPQLMGKDGRSVTPITPRLFGMSLFFQNRYVISKVSHSSEMQCQHSKSAFPPEIPCMVAEYFRSPEKRQIEMGSDATKHAAPQDANITPMVHHAFDRFMSNLSIGPAKNDASKTAQSVSNGSSALNGINFNSQYKSSSGYVEPPPSSFTDIDKPPDFLFVPNLGHQIWLPQIHLPHSERSTFANRDDDVETHVAMFERGDFCFLLFFDLPAPNDRDTNGVLAQMEEELQPDASESECNNEDYDQTKDEGGQNISDETQAFTETLTFLEKELSEFCEKYSSHEPDGVSPVMAPIKEINSDGIFLGEAGMDIIYIDREQSNFVLLSQHDLSSKKFRRITSRNNDGSGGGNSSPPSNGKTQKMRLFGLGTKIKQTCELETKAPVMYQSSPYANIMDCRHKLAAYLPLDVMLAFDDMFNEIGNSSQSTNNVMFENENKSIELCTFLPQGWVYGRANGSQELYVLLDTNKYVTISDVQKAVTRVRDRVFNDKILLTQLC